LKEFTYYPGCALFTKAKNLDQCARMSAEILDVKLNEMPTWNCCGAIFSTVGDDLASQVGPIRNLALASAQGDSLVTLCAACFNVLKRSQAWIAKPGNETTRDRFLNFIEEKEFNPKLKILHYLEVMKNDVGFESIKAKVKKNLAGLKVGSYYGCLMVRPEAEMQFDSVDNPMMMDNLVAALGAAPVYFPFKTECCGGYLLVNDQEASLKCAATIINSLNAAGAEAVVTTCPLCQYNVDNQQKILAERVSGFKKLPVFYFTQLLALALGIEGEVLNLDGHYVDPKPLLKAKGLL
jgi:heterodisulfide reductase subunit B2